MKYLLNYWDKMKEELDSLEIILFLDFDGTLSPIASIPQKAKLPKETKEILERLSNLCKIVIVSGRKLEDVKNKVGLKNIIYVGNHGLEIEGPGIRFRKRGLKEDKKILEKIKENLKNKFLNIKGIIFEDKVFGFGIHYRKVKKRFIPFIKREIRDTIDSLKLKRKIEIKEGKMVEEIRLQTNWDKGKAVIWILQREGNKFPIYLGDDLTDEDAFRVLRKRGLTIFVGRPKISYADYFLRNTQEVKDFLNRLLWKN